MPAQPKILLLDDDQDFLDLYREMLSQHLPSMPEVRAANSGARALSLLESEQFTLLIVDLNLPKTDGREILTEMRATKTFAGVPVVILTSSSSTREREQMQSLRIARHVTKPPDLNGVLQLGPLIREVLDEFVVRK